MIPIMEAAVSSRPIAAVTTAEGWWMRSASATISVESITIVMTVASRVKQRHALPILCTTPTIDSL